MSAFHQYTLEESNDLHVIRRIIVLGSILGRNEISYIVLLIVSRRQRHLDLISNIGSSEQLVSSNRTILLERDVDNRDMRMMIAPEFRSMTLLRVDNEY